MGFLQLLTHSCTIQTRTITQDTTSREMTSSWANTYTSVKCRLDPKGTSEIQGIPEVYQEATHTLFMLPISSFTLTQGKHRFAVTDEITTATYDIVGIDNAGGKGHHWEIYLKLIKN